jgi:hypothetical protein
MTRGFLQDEPKIRHGYVTIELGDEDGEFEGDDASEIWWDGTAASCAARNEHTRVLEREKEIHFGRKYKPRKPWPAQVRRLRSYPRYTRL